MCGCCHFSVLIIVSNSLYPKQKISSPTNLDEMCPSWLIGKSSKVLPALIISGATFVSERVRLWFQVLSSSVNCWECFPLKFGNSTENAALSVTTTEHILTFKGLLFIMAYYCLILQVFSQYEKHRQLILEDIFASLARLPSSKKNLRNFKWVIIFILMHIWALPSNLLILIEWWHWPSVL